MLREQLSPELDLRPWFLTYEDLTLDYGEPPFDLARFWGNDHPLEIEVGTGRGLFLLNAAQNHPGTNFLGMELDFKEGRYAASRMQRRRLPNVRILGGDANVGLSRWLPSSVATAMHVYFPDPWWKRRHRSRRIFQAEFLEQVVRILKPGGLLHAWTDVEEYFGLMQEVAAGNAALRALPPPPERSPEHDLDYLTNFERKKRQAGLPIYRAQWERV